MAGCEPQKYFVQVMFCRGVVWTVEIWLQKVMERFGGAVWDLCGSCRCSFSQNRKLFHNHVVCWCLIDFKLCSLTMATCIACLSASLYTATERTPIFRAVRITRQAISPLLAIRTFSILAVKSKYNISTPIYAESVDVEAFCSCAKYTHQLMHNALILRSIATSWVDKSVRNAWPLRLFAKVTTAALAFLLITSYPGEVS